jgi:hypothetical protein
MDESGGVEFIQADGHGDVGVGAKVELETQAIGGLESAGAIFFRDESAGEAGEAEAAALGGGDVGIAPDGGER